MNGVSEVNFKLDVGNERLMSGDQPVQISNKAFQLLHLFVSKPSRLLTKNEILDAVWGNVCVSEGLIKEYVHDLRLALGDDPKHPKFIETVHGRGYRYLGGVEIVEKPLDTDSRTPTRTRSPSLAVLPFTNLSDTPDQEYFSDGITEDIITGLSKNPYLSVISRNSSFTYKGKSVRIRDVSEDLGVQYVLEGSVRKVEQHIRVTAQLIDAVSDHHLWAETYDRDLDDIFAVQDEVVGSIIHALGARDSALEKSVRQHSLETTITNRSAYDCYLQAREHFYRPDDSGFDAAEALYEKAIDLDPDFSRAYSGLASLHFLRFKLFLTASFESIEKKTLDLALRSVQLDPNDYLGHWVLGRLYSYQGKHTQSLAEFDRALHINPNDANLLVVTTEHLVYCGRVEEALQRCQRAIRLNPNSPDWYWWELGFIYFHLRRYEDALKSIQKMTSVDQARRLLAAVYVYLGRLDEARSEAKEFLKSVPNFSIKEWASTEPYTDPGELEHFVKGLRSAGFPE